MKAESKIWPAHLQTPPLKTGVCVCACVCVYVRVCARQLARDSILGPKTLMTPVNSDITQRNQIGELQNQIWLKGLKAAHKPPRQTVIDWETCQSKQTCPKTQFNLQLHYLTVLASWGFLALLFLGQKTKTISCKRLKALLEWGNCRILCICVNTSALLSHDTNSSDLL